MLKYGRQVFWAIAFGFLALWSAAPVAAQITWNGEFVGIAQKNYAPGRPTNTIIRVQNRGVTAGFFIRVNDGAGWSTNPDPTNTIFIDDDDFEDFDFTITAPAGAPGGSAAIVFDLFVLQNDTFAVFVDQFTAELNIVPKPTDFIAFDPSPGATGLRVPFTFRWDASTYAEHYEIEIFEDNFGNPASTPSIVLPYINPADPDLSEEEQRITTTTHTVTQEELDALGVELLETANYWWQVRALNVTHPTVGTVSTDGPHLFTMAGDDPLGSFDWIQPAEVDLTLPQQPTIQWSSSENVRVYELSVHPSADGVIQPVPIFSERFDIDNPVPSQNFDFENPLYLWDDLPPLDPGEYTIILGAFNRGGTRDPEGGGTRRFFVSSLSDFSLLSPENGATAQLGNPTFTWGNSIGASRYRLELALVNGSERLPLDPITTVLDDQTLTWPGAPLVQGGTYEWQVISIRTGDERESTNGPFQFTVLPLNTFYLLEPLADATGVSESPEFYWQHVRGAYRFIVQITRSLSGIPSESPEDVMTSEFLDANTSAFNLDEIFKLEDSNILSELATDTDYFWRVVAFEPDTNASRINEEGWRKFRTRNTSTFDLLAPADGAIEVSANPTLSWQAVSGATGYKIFLTQEGLGDLPPIVLNEAFPVYAFTGENNLNGDATYTWTVESIGLDGTTQMANKPFTFTTNQRNEASLSDLVDAILGKQRLSVAERQAAGLAAEEQIDITTILESVD